MEFDRITQTRNSLFLVQVHPICLPSSPQLRESRFENTTPFVAGWGAIQFSKPIKITVSIGIVSSNVKTNLLCFIKDFRKFRYFTNKINF
jgi:hypothetical protein